MNDNVDLVVGCCARCGREHADDLKCTARKRMEAELMQGVLDFGGGASAPTHNIQISNNK